MVLDNCTILWSCDAEKTIIIIVIVVGLGMSHKELFCVGADSQSKEATCAEGSGSIGEGQDGTFVIRLSFLSQLLLSSLCFVSQSVMC